MNMTRGYRVNFSPENQTPNSRLATKAKLPRVTVIPSAEARGMAFSEMPQILNRRAAPTPGWQALMKPSMRANDRATKPALQNIKCQIPCRKYTIPCPIPPFYKCILGKPSPRVRPVVGSLGGPISWKGPRQSRDCYRHSARQRDRRLRAAWRPARRFAGPCRPRRTFLARTCASRGR